MTPYESEVVRYPYLVGNLIGFTGEVVLRALRDLRQVVVSPYRGFRNLF